MRSSYHHSERQMGLGRSLFAGALPILAIGMLAVADGRVNPADTSVIAVDPASVAEVEVLITEYKIELPDSITSGETTFIVKNGGSEEHSFAIKGGELESGLPETLAAGESGTLMVNLDPGVYEAFDPITDDIEPVQIVVIPSSQ